MPIKEPTPTAVSESIPGRVGLLVPEKVSGSLSASVPPVPVARPPEKPPVTHGGVCGKHIEVPAEYGCFECLDANGEGKQTGLLCSNCAKEHRLMSREDSELEHHVFFLGDYEPVLPLKEEHSKCMVHTEVVVVFDCHVCHQHLCEKCLKDKKKYCGTTAGLKHVPRKLVPAVKEEEAQVGARAVEALILRSAGAKYFAISDSKKLQFDENKMQAGSAIDVLWNRWKNFLDNQQKQLLSDANKIWEEEICRIEKHVQKQRPEVERAEQACMGTEELLKLGNPFEIIKGFKELIRQLRVGVDTVGGYLQGNPFTISDIQYTPCSTPISLGHILYTDDCSKSKNENAEQKKDTNMISYNGNLRECRMNRHGNGLSITKFELPPVCSGAKFESCFPIARVPGEPCSPVFFELFQGQGLYIIRPPYQHEDRKKIDHPHIDQIALCAAASLNQNMLYIGTTECEIYVHQLNTEELSRWGKSGGKRPRNCFTLVNKFKVSETVKLNAMAVCPSTGRLAVAGKTLITILQPDGTVFSVLDIRQCTHPDKPTFDCFPFDLAWSKFGSTLNVLFVWYLNGHKKKFVLGTFENSWLAAAEFVAIDKPSKGDIYGIACCGTGNDVAVRSVSQCKGMTRAKSVTVYDTKLKSVVTLLLCNGDSPHCVWGRDGGCLSVVHYTSLFSLAPGE